MRRTALDRRADDGADVIGLDSATRVYRSTAHPVVALDGVTMSVSAGELVAVVGPSGSGKTTMLNLLLGWERPDSGAVVGAVSTGWHDVAVIPQELGLLAELTVAENVDLARRLGGVGSSEARGVDALLDRLGLAALGERHPDELSMGEQQRTAVARALAASPRFIVADEPTAHQDERRTAVVMEEFVVAAAGGAGVLVATHDERVLRGVDRVIALLDGRIVAEPDGR